MFLTVGILGRQSSVTIPRGSLDITMVRESQLLNIRTWSLDKARSIVTNIGRALVAKKTLSLGSKELEVIENSDIFDTYKDLYLTKTPA